MSGGGGGGTNGRYIAEGAGAVQYRIRGFDNVVS